MYITGLIMTGKHSFVKALLRPFSQLGQQAGQLQKRLDGKFVRRLRRAGGCIRQTPVCPLLGYGVAATVGVMQNEGIDTRGAPGL